MMTIFPKFSSELSAQIVSYLEADNFTLSQLSLVSKFVYAYVTPILYRSYIQRTSNVSSKTNIYLFLRTILERPDLAQHVQKIKLHHWQGVDEQPEFADSESADGKAVQKDQENSDDETVLEEGSDGYEALSQSYVGWISYHWLKKVDPDEKIRKIWLKAILNKEKDAMVALLLALVPNLEKLAFPEVFRPLYVKHIMAAAGDIYQRSRTGYRDPRFTQPWRGLQNLHSVRAESDDGKYGYLGMSDLDPLYRLKGMRSLEIIMANMEEIPQDHDEEPPFPKVCPAVWEMAAGSSPITRLCLQDSAISRTCIRPFLRPFTALREFYYTYGRIHMYGSHFRPTDLRNALDHVKGTLEVLCCDFDDFWDKWATESYDDVVFYGPGLIEFTALKTLSCSQQALTGLLHDAPEEIFDGTDRGDVLLEAPEDLRAPHLVESLPQSIEKVRVGYCDIRVLDQVRELASAMNEDGSKFPNLHQVDLLFAKPTTKPDEIPTEELAGIATFKVNVTFGSHACEGDQAAMEWWFEGKQSIFGDELLTEWKERATEE